MKHFPWTTVFYLAVAVSSPISCAKDSQPPEGRTLFDRSRYGGGILYAHPMYKNDSLNWLEMYWVSKDGGYLRLLYDMPTTTHFEGPGNYSPSGRFYMYAQRDLTGPAGPTPQVCGFIDLSNGCIGGAMDATCEGHWDSTRDDWVQSDGSKISAEEMLGEPNAAQNFLEALKYPAQDGGTVYQINDREMFEHDGGIQNLLRCNALSPETIDAYQSILGIFKKHRSPKARNYLQKAIDDYTKKHPSSETSP
ncbi:hypothetical protein [Dyella japonica]|uniref:Uncharacterized protein n=1 Tax=Dyella japonica TaxID=231455 RepID=A0ABV2K1B5_9GAMM